MEEDSAVPPSPPCFFVLLRDLVCEGQSGISLSELQHKIRAWIGSNGANCPWANSGVGDWGEEAVSAVAFLCGKLGAGSFLSVPSL